MNKNGSGGSQIAAAMAIVFFIGFCARPFVQILGPAIPALRAGRTGLSFALTEADAVAFLTRLAGKIPVKNPKRISPRLTWTGLNVGGPCLGTFGMNRCEEPFRPFCGTLNSKKLLRC
jgi:hypothetical protein